MSGSPAPREARAIDIYLASRSPRRRELLDQLGIRYRIIAADVEERRSADESPRAYVRRVAEDKARAGLAASPGDRPVLGADTDVVLDDTVLGKPSDRADGVAMLGRLAGRTHEVISAVAIATGAGTESRVQVSRVTFGALDGATLDAYWRTGEPADKAGAYAIQGRAAAFVSHLDGSFSGVMGLPLHETAQLLRAAGIDPLARTAA